MIHFRIVEYGRYGGIMIYSVRPCKMHAPDRGGELDGLDTSVLSGCSRSP